MRMPSCGSGEGAGMVRPERYSQQKEDDWNVNDQLRPP